MIHMRANANTGTEDVAELTRHDQSATRDIAEIANDLIEAARLIETSAIALAGEVAGGQVTHLLLLSQQLERISTTLAE